MKISATLKILAMVVSLAAVIYAIQSLRSPDFANKMADPASSVGLLIGGEYRPANWCPPGTVQVVIFNKAGDLVEKTKEPKDIAAVCEIMMGAFSNEGTDENLFFKKVVASDSKGSSKSLEQNGDSDIYRTQGLPFSSPMLTKALHRLNGAK